MKKIHFFLFICLIICTACNNKKNTSDNLAMNDSLEIKTKNDTVDLQIGKKITHTLIDSLTGKEYKLSFTLDWIDSKKIPMETVKEKKYVVTAYSSYQRNDKFEKQLNKWKELEPNTCVEIFGDKKTGKFLVVIAQTNEKKELFPLWNKFKNKYPNDNINCLEFNKISKKPKTIN